MPELLSLRGKMNKRFPSAKNDTLSADIYSLVQKYLNGLMIAGERDKSQADFGLVQTAIGTVNYIYFFYLFFIQLLKYYN